MQMMKPGGLPKHPDPWGSDNPKNDPTSFHTTALPKCNCINPDINPTKVEAILYKIVDKAGTV